MDAARFDALTKFLGAASTRRRALTGLLALSLALALIGDPAQAVRAQDATPAAGVAAGDWPNTPLAN